MKHIALLRDDRPLWDDVTQCLRDANATLSSFAAEWATEDVIGISPDMIVTNVPSLSQLKICLRRIPKVAVQAGAHEAHLIPTSRLEWNLEIVEWPADKDLFLEVTARQLALSPRKNFSAIFHAVPDGDGAVAMAQTTNLSMSGLAFKSIAEFEVGQRLRIALDLPGERDTLEALAKVVRSDGEDDDDPRTTYGAEYVEPSDRFMMSLKRFIHTY